MRRGFMGIEKQSNEVLEWIEQRCITGGNTQMAGEVRKILTEREALRKINLKNKRDEKERLLTGCGV